MQSTGYVSNQFNDAANIPYSHDFVGAVQMLGDAGLAPFSDSSPLSSTLSQIFTEFVEKTGLNSDSTTLKNDFLAQTPSAGRAMDLYESLDNTFSARGEGEQAVIVDFLNSRIDSFITDNDQDGDGSLNAEESTLSTDRFNTVDADSNLKLNSEEIQNDFYGGYRELGNVLNHFRSNSGVLLDLYA
ncbi:MAG: hypothetical protein GY765_03500 [bacterium]|nr:hypothetical protein [bacterium]